MIRIHEVQKIMHCLYKALAEAEKIFTKSWISLNAGMLNSDFIAL
jgi:hypothetical protein